MCALCPPGSSPTIRLDRRRLLGLLGGAGAAALLAGCDEGPPINLVAEETVEQLGLESWQRLRQESPVSRDADLQAALQSVGRRLLQSAGEDPRGWEMVVFAGPEVNAFALPGRKVGVFEGMFGVARDEHGLAAVVGHEIGHLQADHPAERMNVAVLKGMGLKLVGTALELGDVAYANEIAGLLGLGATFGVELPYSRNHELEADRLGVALMARAGFEPRAAVELWRRMEQTGNRGPAFLSTHPAPAARAKALEELLAAPPARR